MMYNLNDTTFIIPVRIDSIVRLENLLLTIECIESSFKTNIIVLEASYYNSGILKQLLNNSINYNFVEDKDPIFHRTKHLNSISRFVDTDYIGIWDADIVLENIQIMDAVEQLRSGNCEFAYPYDGRFLDISEIMRNHYIINKDIEFLKRNTQKMNLIYTSTDEGKSVGGAFLISTKKYRQSGMDNEAFYGWGPEDMERFYRWLILDYRLYRSEGALFHLTHPRDHNGMIRSEYHEYKTMYEYSRIRSMTKNEILSEFHE